MVQTIEFLYNQGKKKFRVEDSKGRGTLYNYDDRIAHNTVAYELCIDNGIYPDFFCTLCKTLADDQFHRGNGPVELKKAIAILETAMEHGRGQNGYDDLGARLEQLRKQLDKYQNEGYGFTDSVMELVEGFHLIDPYLQSNSSFHDGRILAIHYDADELEVTARIQFSTLLPDNDNIIATVRFYGVRRFESNTDSDNDYISRMTTNVMNGSLVVNFNGGYYSITCDCMGFLKIEKLKKI